MPDTDPSIDRLYHDPALARFYDLDNGWEADLHYCAGLAAGAGSVLDLGCGTGQLAASLADGRRAVCGADPAGAMLDIARARAGGERVTWVEADARSLRLDRRFDLVVLTGHAFQVFLTDQDQRDALATIAAHLAPGGRFIFDSRNPAVFDTARPDAPIWDNWRPEESHRRFEAPGLGTVEAWGDVTLDARAGIVTYETHYKVVASGERVSAASKIRFTDRAVLADLLADAGLAAEQWLGDWAGNAFKAVSPDIIPLGRLL